MRELPSWVHVYFPPDQLPGSGEACACFFALQLAGHFPGGALELCEEPESMLFGQVTLRDTGLYSYVLEWCPACGGKMAPYRPELVAAHARFRAAAAGYGEAAARQDFEGVEAACADQGARELVSESDYHREWVDRANALVVTASYDPDHERVYTRCRFFPGEALEARPYRDE